MSIAALINNSAPDEAPVASGARFDLTWRLPFPHPPQPLLIVYPDLRQRLMNESLSAASLCVCPRVRVTGSPHLFWFRALRKAKMLSPFCSNREGLCHLLSNPVQKRFSFRTLVFFFCPLCLAPAACLPLVSLRLTVLLMSKGNV